MKAQAEADAIPQELEIDRIKAVTSNLQVGDADDKEFEKRLRISEQLLKERDIAVKEGTAAQRAPQAQPRPQAQPQAQPPMMQPPQGQLPQ